MQDIHLATTEGGQVVPADADFEIYEDGELFAATSGPRKDAMREAIHYAFQCAGRTEIFEVTRKRTFPFEAGAQSPAVSDAQMDKKELEREALAKENAKLRETLREISSYISTGPNKSSTAMADELCFIRDEIAALSEGAES